MLNFPFIDLSIAVIVIWAAISGLRRGFLKSLLKLSSFILSLLLAYFLTGGIIRITGNWFGIKAGAQAILDAVFQLLIIIVLFSLFEIIFTFIEGRIMRNRSIGGSEAAGKILGLLVGVVKAAIIVVVALTLSALLFPGDNPVTAEIEKSIVGRFLFEKNPIPAFVAKYLV